MEKEYRTQEQFEEIAESVINGNWTTAGEECVEYGFWTSDLMRINEEQELISMENMVWLIHSMHAARRG